MKELRELAVLNGFEVRSFSPIHSRVFGSTVVDYWPTSGRAWVTGSNERAREMAPHEVIELACEVNKFESLPEGAEDHMRSLQ
jgi:hypothetical protein